jgi:hypothetical protein
MDNNQLYSKKTIPHNNRSFHENISNFKKGSREKIDIVKYTFEKQSESTSEIFKKMRDTIATTPGNKK